MIKIVFLDVDGTLLSHNTNAVSSKTKEAIRLLQDHQIKVFVCSGRSNIEFNQITQLSDVCFDGHILMGGAMSLYNHEIISEYPISSKDVEEIYRYQLENPFSMIAVEKDNQYINFINDYAIRAYDAVHTAIPDAQDFSQVLHNKIYQFVAFASQNELEKLSKRVNNILITSWNPYGYDLVSKYSGKGNAIKDVCQYFGYSLEECLAIGDGENDIDMLQTVGTSVAMGNALDNVKEISDYITSDIDEDGVYHALKHYNLI